MKVIWVWTLWETQDVVKHVPDIVDMVSVEHEVLIACGVHQGHLIENAFCIERATGGET